MGAFLTLGGAVVWVVVFAAMAEPKHSAQFVFTEFINNSGYSNNAWVFFMSFYTPTYALYGTDGILHMVRFRSSFTQSILTLMIDQNR